MLSEALQRNAKHEARLSKIPGQLLAHGRGKRSEIFRFVQNESAPEICL
jgi:hypothetical protein